MKQLALAVAAMTMVGCSSLGGSGQYAGYYVSSFERSLFKPATSSERWWLAGSYSCPNTNIDLLPAGGGATEPVFLVVNGQLSAKGKHGHMGAYDRLLEVTETVSCRPLGKDEKVEF